jgi:hypothetical protein
VKVVHEVWIVLACGWICIGGIWWPTVLKAKIDNQMERVEDSFPLKDKGVTEDKELYIRDWIFFMERTMGNSCSNGILHSWLGLGIFVAGIGLGAHLVVVLRWQIVSEKSADVGMMDLALGWVFSMVRPIGHSDMDGCLGGGSLWSEWGVVVGGVADGIRESSDSFVGKTGQGGCHEFLVTINASRLVTCVLGRIAQLSKGRLFLRGFGDA